MFRACKEMRKFMVTAAVRTDDVDGCLDPARKCENLWSQQQCGQTVEVRVADVDEIILKIEN